jgi:hypothetical protein
MPVICSPCWRVIGLNQLSHWAMLATTLRWWSIAPLDTPVVPPVYCRKARSSGPGETRLSVIARPAPSAVGQRVSVWPLRSGSDQAGISFLTWRTTVLISSRLSVGSASPSCVTSTWRTRVWAITGASVAAKFSRMTIASAPESASWCDSSRGV